jgi:hypothetical protein
MRGNSGNTGGLGMGLQELPNDFLGQRFALRNVGTVHGTKDAPVRYGRRRGPRVDRNFHPGWHRDGAHPSVFPDQIDDAPAAIALLKMREGQVRGFRPTEAAPEKDCQDGAVAQPLKRSDVWRVQKRLSLPG